MKKEQDSPKQKFHKEFMLFKDHRKPGYDLKNIFEIYLPFWFCRQNVIAEKEIELDRFSKILLQTIQSGFAKHSQVCRFLGVEINSFVTTQLHFLLKYGLLEETPLSNDTEYKITFDGVSFLNKKKKVTAVETVEFEYFYNDITLEFLDKSRFDFLMNDLTRDFVDASKPINVKEISTVKRKQFSGYQVLQTNLLPPNRIEIPHGNRPYNLNKLDFANFFNKQNRGCSFYDFDSSIETHKRSICFLAFEYVDNAGASVYDIRHFKKTVKEFDRHEIEQTLSKRATDYLKKFH